MLEESTSHELSHDFEKGPLVQSPFLTLLKDKNPLLISKFIVSNSSDLWRFFCDAIGAFSKIIYLVQWCNHIYIYDYTIAMSDFSVYLLKN